MKTLCVNIDEIKPIKCDEIKNFSNLNYKMYAIVSIPRMYFKKPKCEESLIKYTITDNKKDYHFYEEVKFEGDAFDINIVSDYPCEYMFINNEKMIASDIFMFCNIFDKDIKIEYIGISARHNAAERLKNHTTLQNILSKFQSEHCYRDLYICLFNANYFDIKMLNSNPNNNEIEEFVNKIDEAYNKDEIVTALVEASLINIFKPTFNVEYSNSTSNAKFKSLNNLYDYGFDNCTINLSLNKTNVSGYITISTDKKSIQLNKENGFHVTLNCPFKKLKNEK